MILRAERLTKYYGEFRALHGVSLAVDAGEFVSIIGPNGAGKSTLVNLLTGLARPSAGTVRFKERDITGIGPVRLAKPPSRVMKTMLPEWVQYASVGSTLPVGVARSAPPTPA